MQAQLQLDVNSFAHSPHSAFPASQQASEQLAFFHMTLESSEPRCKQAFERLFGDQHQVSQLVLFGSVYRLI
jgi:hypothetical protein